MTSAGFDDSLNEPSLFSSNQSGNLEFLIIISVRKVVNMFFFLNWGRRWGGGTFFSLRLQCLISSILPS